MKYKKRSEKLKHDSKFSKIKRMNSWDTAGGPCLHERKLFWQTVKASYAARPVNIAGSVSVETDSQPVWKCFLPQQSRDISPQLHMCLIASKIIHRLLQIMTGALMTIRSCRGSVSLMVNQHNPWWKFRCDGISYRHYCSIKILLPMIHWSVRTGLRFVLKSDLCFFTKYLSHVVMDL